MAAMRSRVVFAVVVVAALLSFAPPAAAARGALTVGRLRWDGRDRPLGFIQFEPRLGWVVSASKRGQRQTAYQILVASDPARLKPGVADVWDSNKVVSADSINVRYAGPPLQARQRAYFTVRVWDKEDRPSPFAPASWWEVGLLDEEWEGQWIGRPVAPGGAAEVFDRSVTHLRKTFSVPKGVQRARLYASAFGVYELSINGKRAGVDVLAPGYTDYEKRVAFQAYDVTSLVRRGDNAIGALVAGGWCTAALGGRAGACGVEPPRVMAQLEIVQSDGTLLTIITDRSWKAHAGPITSSHLVDGESYDARLELPGWDTPRFDDAGWLPVAQYDRKKERDLVADPGPPIRVTEDVRPVQVTEPQKGVYVFDLGQNILGRARLRASVPPGTTIALRYGEALAPNGTIAAPGGRAGKSMDSYIARGAGTETWEARFAVHGFRYVEVAGLRARPGLDAITGRIVQSVTPSTGRLETSDPRLDRLFKAILDAQRAAFLSVPSTGLHRDEPPGALLDGRVFAATGCLNADVMSFYRKWIDDIRDAQLPDASYTATAPTLDQAPSQGRARRAAGPGTAAGGVLVPWALFRCYADRTALDAHLPSMGRWLNHLRDTYPTLVWSQPASEPVDPRVKGPAPDPALIGTAEIGYAAESLAQMMRHAGPSLDGEARGFEELARAARAAFARTFLRPDGKLTSDTQTAYAVAIALGAVPAEARARAGAQLVAAIERAGRQPTTGLLGTAHLLPALSLIGRDDLAYRVLQEVNPESHFAFGGVGEWMYAAIGGLALDPRAPAGRHVVVHPRPGPGLTHARARHDSLYGPIATDWRQDGKTFHLKLSVPANSTATVTLPYPGPATEGGLPLASAPGVRVIGPAAGGGTTVTVESGSYEFAVAMPSTTR
jgi:alpha-L-rhamnosidase